jgi:hypothetical protein
VLRPTIRCKDCNRRFINNKCVQLHRENKVCDEVKRCPKCNRMIAGKSHDCRKYKCRYCQSVVTSPHDCYIQPLDRKNVPTEFIFFDIESASDDDGLQIAILVIAKTSGGEELEFYGTDCISQFCDYIFKKFIPRIQKEDKEKPKEEQRNIRMIAHNASGYDGFFVLQYFHAENLLPHVVYNGAKLLSLSFSPMRFKLLDSFLFLPMALAKLPKAFGLKTMVKGHFPHLLNKLDKQDFECVGLPPLPYYDPDSKKPDDRKQLLAWHKSENDRMKKNGEKFVLKAEMIKYCRDDVQILAESCRIFRNLVLEIAGVDPFQSITLASMCISILRTRFLIPKSIALIPPNGYSTAKRYSKVSLEWLSWIESSQGKCIQHALSPGGEVKLGSLYADGYCSATKEIFLFHGCVYHGCLKCFDKDGIAPFSDGLTYGEKYEITKDKEERILASAGPGHHLNVIWECEFRKLRQTDLSVKEYCSNLDISQVMHPRDALYGGRVAPNRLHFSTKNNPNLVASYYDFVSLYPTCMKYCKYPIGVPEILFESYVPKDHFGLVKCTVLPPTNLHIPVLPMRHNGKLFFPLCSQCVKDQNTTFNCNHNEDERKISGVYCTPELELAVEHGYRVLQTHCIWHYKNSEQYDTMTKTGGLFTGYIDTFLKIKMEASGFPDGVLSDEDKQTFVQSVYENEGVKLDIDKIEKCEPLRQIAKLCLNNLWGKLGQRLDKTKSEYINSPARFFDMLRRPAEFRVHSANPINDDVLLVTYSTPEDMIDNNGTNNPVIASFVTSHARIKLYSILDLVAKQCGPQSILYHDTDSWIFSHPPGKNPLSSVAGSSLGQMTDELGNGCYITDFVSSGPKSYSYRTNTGKVECKLKGVSLSFKNIERVNFDSILTLVHDPHGDPIITSGMTMRRDKIKATVTSKQFKKEIRYTFDKGIVGEHTIVYPYGFRGVRN